MSKKRRSNLIDYATLLENEKIVKHNVVDEMEESILNYSIKTIVDRALPDVRDGLKPAQRRILYAMHDLGMFPNKAYSKSAKVTGHVMGKFHPHGDTYGVMVNMTNELGIRYPVVDGQGNFGHPLDGEGAAAARYTEVKLHKHGVAMLQDVDKDVVDFQPNYSEDDEEPTILPAAFPYLLANGQSGIATGYTTDIPSHNLGELVDGLLALIKSSDLTNVELMKYVKGPDLVTGGSIVNPEEIIKLYETGQASLRFRANMETEINDDGNVQIIVKDLPPDVRKASAENKVGVVEKLYQICVQEKKIPRVLDVRDESTGKVDKKTGKIENPVRIVIELHKTAIPEVIMQELYKQTPLEKSKGYIMRAVYNQAPILFSLKEMLMHFLNHRREVVLRRTKFDLNKALKRLHILEGFKKVFLNMDDVIHVIRTSDNPDTDLMAKYSLSKEQVKAILDMPLRSLSKMQESKVDAEIEERNQEIEMYEYIINDPAEIDNIVSEELKQLKSQFKDARKTKILNPNELNNSLENSVEGDMICILTSKNTIKQIPEAAFDDMVKTKVLKERTEIYTQGVKCGVSDEFVLILDSGEYVRTSFNDLMLIDFLDSQKIVGFFVLDQEDDDKTVVVVTKKGMVKKSKMKSFRAKSKRVAPYIELSGEDDAIVAIKITDGDELNNTIVIATENGVIHRFSENAFTSSNPGGKGVPCISQDVIKDGDAIADFGVVKKDADDKNIVVLYCKGNDDTVLMKSMSLTEFIPKGRVSKGILGAAKVFKDKVYKLKLADNDFMIVDKKGFVHNQKFVSIPVQNRYNKPEPISFEPLVTDFFLEEDNETEE